MSKSVIVIRTNAAVDEVIVNGQVFDRTKMTREDKGLMRSMIRDHLFPRVKERLSRRQRKQASKVAA